MAGPSEQKLMKALSARPGQLHEAATAWRKAASGLEEVASALDAGKQQIAQSWQGSDADAATAAFTTLATVVRTNKDRMHKAASALDLAGSALQQAKSDYHSLPPVPPVPDAPEADASGAIPIQEEVHYLKLSGARSAAMSRREAAAATSYQQAVGTLTDAKLTMADAAPEAVKRTSGDPGGPTGGVPGDSGGSSSGSGSGLPGGAGLPVGVYRTGTSGTYVSSSQLIGISAPHLEGQLAGDHLTSQVIHTGGQGVSVDGIVGGTVPGVGEGLGGGGNGTGVLNGTTGGLSGGAAGGMAGVVGGGGLLGALRGAKSGGSTVSGASGAVRGIGGVVPGAVSEGAVGGSTAAGAARGGVLGGTARPATTGGVTGAPASTSGGGSSAGAASGGRPGVVAGSGSGAGTGSGSGSARGEAGGGAGSRSGGRYLSSDGRGGSGTPAEGRGARSGGMQPGGRVGEGDPSRTGKRKSMVFEDEDAWIDDDDLGPGVMK